jgi:hypothetical protein
MRAVAELEARIAADVDELEVEPELHLRLPHDLERTLAEATVRRVEDRYLRYG